MNKIVLVLLCATASSFLSAMENKSSSRALDAVNSLRSNASQSQSSPQYDYIPTRSRIPSDPIFRVKSQYDAFFKEENVGQKTEDALIGRKRGASDGQ